MSPSVVVDEDGAWLEERINSSNLERSRAIWRLLEGTYDAIDWQIDFKSGFRWSESVWSRDITYGDVTGADIKVPWELARLQHLPILALAHAVEDPGDALGNRAPGEFRNQVVDFVATNPPRYGVNWASTMDVAIRIANVLVAHDLFRAQGIVFDPDFEELVLSTTYDHVRFIVDHLEWNETVRANHYLADIAGLVVACAYLPSTPEVDGWLTFGREQLIEETRHQFGPDGGNFEASTCYHRLSGEMVSYATAFACAAGAARDEMEPASNEIRSRYGIPEPASRWTGDFPDAHWATLAGIAGFVVSITKPSGRVPQIGDNDSGRFFKLTPRFDNPKDLIEEHLDHRHLVAAVNGFFDDEEWAAFGGDHRYETALISSLVGSVRRRPQATPHVKPRAAVAAGSNMASRATFVIHLPGPPLTSELQLLSFPYFGLYLFRSERLYLATRCGSVGQDGNGGHAHNDQLGIELMVDGVEWLSDPGTFVYTPLPDERNRYRSVAAHFAPRCGNHEPAPLGAGLFRLPETTKAWCSRFEGSVFLGHHMGFGERTSREIRVGDDAITIVDEVPARCASDDLSFEIREPEDLQRIWRPPPFSPGYGRRHRASLPVGGVD